MNKDKTRTVRISDDKYKKLCKFSEDTGIWKRRIIDNAVDMYISKQK